MTRQLANFFNLVFGFRKFILMLALFLVGILFRFYGYLSGAEFVDLLKATTISFFAANSGEHILTTIQAHLNSKGSAVPAAASVPSDDIAQPDEDDSAASSADAKVTT